MARSAWPFTLQHAPHLVHSHPPPNPAPGRRFTSIAGAGPQTADSLAVVPGNASAFVSGNAWSATGMVVTAATPSGSEVADLSYVAPEGRPKGAFVLQLAGASGAPVWLRVFDGYQEQVGGGGVGGSEEQCWPLVGLATSLACHETRMCLIPADSPFSPVSLHTALPFGAAGLPMRPFAFPQRRPPRLPTPPPRAPPPSCWSRASSTAAPAASRSTAPIPSTALWATGPSLWHPFLSPPPTRRRWSGR